MRRRLEGRVAIITVGTSGIGAASAMTQNTFNQDMAAIRKELPGAQG